MLCPAKKKNVVSKVQVTKVLKLIYPVKSTIFVCRCGVVIYSTRK